MISITTESENAALTHILLCCMAGKGISMLLKPRSLNFSHVGLHLNFFLHGVLGFLIMRQNRPELSSAYSISMKATHTLALPSILADMVHDRCAAKVHALSGIVAFLLAVVSTWYDTKVDYTKVVLFYLVANIIILSYYSLIYKSDWGWYTLGAALVAYFVAPQDDKVKYPLSLALMQYWQENAAISHILLCCLAFKGLSMLLKPGCLRYSNLGLHLNFFIFGVAGFLKIRKDNSDISSVYSVSMKATRTLAIPFLLADMVHDQNMMAKLHAVLGVVMFLLSFEAKDKNNEMVTYFLIINIIALAFYSLMYTSAWGWFTVGAAVIAYFVAPQDDKVKYPLLLALMQFCAYNVNSHVNFDLNFFRNHNPNHF